MIFSSGPSPFRIYVDCGTNTVSCTAIFTNGIKKAGFRLGCRSVVEALPCLVWTEAFCKCLCFLFLSTLVLKPDSLAWTFMIVERGNVVDGESKLSQAVSLDTYCPPPESDLTCSWLLGKAFGMRCLAECWLPTMKLSVINMSETCSCFPILLCPSYLIAPPKCLVNTFLYKGFFFSPETIKAHIPSCGIECRPVQPEIMFPSRGYSYLAQNQQSLIPLRVRAVSHQHWQALRPRFHSQKYRKKHRNPSNREEDLESKFQKETLSRSTV